MKCATDHDTLFNQNQNKWVGSMIKDYKLISIIFHCWKNITNGHYSKQI